MAASTSLTLNVSKCPSSNEALTNKVYLHPEEAAMLAAEGKSKGSLDCAILVQSSRSRKGPYVFTFEGHEKIKKGEIGFSGPQRKCAEVSMREPVTVDVFVPHGSAEVIQLNVSFRKKTDVIAGEIDTERLADTFMSLFSGQVFTVTQDVVVDYLGSMLILHVADVRHEAHSNVDLGERGKQGLLAPGTQIVFSPSSSSDNPVKLSGESAAGPSLFKADWNFEDLGIGGLDNEFSDIFRRAFASRTFSSKLIKELNIKHVKGILLYGPPGTGKTLMARQIGKMLNAVPPKIINGPEVFSKYVGESEKNIREYFAPAEADEAKYGDASPLHIIIFDEMDAVVRQRGSRSGDTGAGDQVVNQLLSKIDGVDALNNVLIIGMTNRKDMLDEAILRPGRLEVHIEVSLPTEEGRVQIFNIHTKSARENNRLASDVDVEELAALTKNYTGAEIEGVVKSAVSFALQRAINPPSGAGEGSSGAGASDSVIDRDEDSVLVTRNDFIQAIGEVRPALGASSEDLDLIIAAGMINYGPKYQRLMGAGSLLIQQVLHSRQTSPLITALVAGPRGCGKSSVALTLAQNEDVPFFRHISPDMYVSFSELAKCDRIVNTFMDAYKSETAVIVIDDIERIVEYSALGGRFSNRVLQTLMAYLNRPPPKGHSLLVLATTSNTEALKALNLLQLFDGVLSVPLLTSGSEVAAVLRSLGIASFDDAVCDRIENEFAGEVPIKKLIMMAGMSAQDADPVGRFFDLLLSNQTDGIARLN